MPEVRTEAIRRDRALRQHCKRADATLRAEVRPGNEMALDVAPGQTIAQIVAPFHLPPALVHLVLVNGKYVPPEARASTTLSEGDALAIWPPIAGG